MLLILSKNRYLSLLLMGLFLCLTASRRWAQLVSPQVWDEDGTQIIHYFLRNGWDSIWMPVNGYLILLPKLISFISMSISFLYYPMVSTLLSFVFIALVGLAITLSPTHLKGRFFCALAVFFVPTNPEVFGLPLYTFWWAALLLFLLVFWDERTTCLEWRTVFLILGGLSSPIIALVLPLLYVRAFLYRKHPAEIFIAIVASIIAGIQLYFILPAGQNPDAMLFSNMLFKFIPDILGNYGTIPYQLSTEGKWVFGGFLLTLLCLWLFTNRQNITTWFLIFLCMGAIAMVSARVDLHILHPNLAGPRYFFYPFIFISWMLIQFWYSTHNILLKGTLLAIALSTVITAFTMWSRDHVDLHWKEHILKCRHSTGDYTIPIEFDGSVNVWTTPLSSKRCDELLNKQLFP